jgi:hypothetical protein
MRGRKSGCWLVVTKSGIRSCNFNDLLELKRGTLNRLVRSRGFMPGVSHLLLGPGEQWVVLLVEVGGVSNRDALSYTRGQSEPSMLETPTLANHLADNVMDMDLERKQPGRADCARLRKNSKEQSSTKSPSSVLELVMTVADRTPQPIVSGSVTEERTVAIVMLDHKSRTRKPEAGTAMRGDAIALVTIWRRTASPMRFLPARGPRPLSLSRHSTPPSM